MTIEAMMRKLCECTDIDAERMVTMLEEHHSDTVFEIIVQRIKELQRSQEISLGDSNLASWQDDFPKTVFCDECHKEARLMFTYKELSTVGPEKICHQHGYSDTYGLWIHDLCAVAVYLCGHCFAASALVNQA